jgi:DNA-binding NtrC family response regulator
MFAASRMSNTVTEDSRPLPPNPIAPFAVVVDDEEAICRFVARALARLGVESSTYQTAEPAVASLDQRRPDIVFLDIALAQSDAIDVIKGLSEKHYTGPIQLMSGGRLPLLEAVQRIGARNGLSLRPPLQKPFRAEALREVIVSEGLASGAPPSTELASGLRPFEQRSQETS